jgi:hypothetical protein
VYVSPAHVSQKNAQLKRFAFIVLYRQSRGCFDHGAMTISAARSGTGNRAKRGVHSIKRPNLEGKT